MLPIDRRSKATATIKPNLKIVRASITTQQLHAFIQRVSSILLRRYFIAKLKVFQNIQSLSSF
ncbi:MAG: hypothetical protein QXD95_02820 [Nitrososphaeria archaeon]